MATPSTFAPTSEQQGWAKTAFDKRTFSDLIADTLDELNKPDLQQPAIRAIQDAILYWRKKPFFFTNRDNRTTRDFTWQAGWFWTLGATIRRTVDDVDYAFVACTQGFSGQIEPTWPNVLAVSPSYGQLFTGLTIGCVDDNEVVWANAGVWSGNTASSVLNGVGYDQYGLSDYWTQLSMVPNINQYNVPLDFIAPSSLRVTISGITYPIPYFTYDDYAALDIIRPPVLTNFPANWTYSQQRIIIWPWPNQFAPMFLMYSGSDMPPVQPTDINTWTTVGARLIRCYARGILNRDVTRDLESAAADFKSADDEYQNLLTQQVFQSQTTGIPPSEW